MATQQLKIPSIIIAGTHSGCGKTTIALGIMAAFVRKGLTVQPFKVGPDYLDPMLHTFITGRFSGNLDSWLLKKETVTALFRKNSSGADVAVIEGVMGLYDGLGGYSLQASTAHVARLLDAPVVLVVNGEGLALSLAALINGYKNFYPPLRLKGIIINKVKTQQHYQLLKTIIEKHTGLSVMGYLPAHEPYSLPRRHLGLLPGEEIDHLKERLDILARQVEQTIDLPALLRIAGEERMNTENNSQTCRRAPVYPSPVPEEMDELRSSSSLGPTIAVARDKAFNFYYQDNLDLLTALGARLVYFSPLKDDRLPPDLDGLYIGGGYPEVYAKELAANHSLKAAIHRSIQDGLPAYAECGGLLYMSRTLEDHEGRIFDMVGIIPGKSKMTTRLQRFGYIHIEATADNVLAKKGFHIHGHEFHYAVIEVDKSVEPCWSVTKAGRHTGTAVWTCGYKVNNLLAGFPHLHFWGNIEFAREFVYNCLQYKKSKVCESRVF